MGALDRSEAEKPDWADPKWRRAHLREWEIKQRQAKEPAGWKAARAGWAQEAAARADETPPHIQSLVDAVANSEAPLRTEVRADLESEIARRLAARHKE